MSHSFKISHNYLGCRIYVGLDKVVTYLRADLRKTQYEIGGTIECHIKLSFLVDLYEHHLTRVVDVDGDDTEVAYHIACALMAYLLVLVATSIFMDKGTTYVNVIYLRYFIHFERIHEYN